MTVVPGHTPIRPPDDDAHSLSTPREDIEQALLERFGGVIRPNDESLRPFLEHFHDPGFGGTLLALLLYCNGRNPSASSRRYPDGLCYCSDEAMFGLGTFVTQFGGGVHLVAPRGPGCIKATTRVAAFLNKCRPGIAIYARHLSLQLQQAMVATGIWAPGNEAPWLPSAPQEDETYHHRLLRLSDLIESTRKGYRVQLLNGVERRQFRRKARLAHNRFENFLARAQARYELRAQQKATVPQTLDLVRGHFDDLHRAGKTTVGSSHHDYAGLAQLVADDNSRARTLIGFLEGPDWRRAVSFFAIEQLADGALGCYASIIRRDPRILPAHVDPQGFSAIAGFALTHLAARLLAEGVETLDLGGSETADLDRFKRQLGASQAPTGWAIFRGAEQA